MTHSPHTQDWQILLADGGFERYQALRAFIRGLTSDQAIADDVLQETLLRTSKSARYTELENPLAYMITVAKSVLYDHQRKKLPNSVDWQSEELEAANDSPENSYYHVQKLAFIESILRDMSPLRRDVFIMRRVEGLSREDIANRLNVSVEVVKKHLTRAMVEITLKLEDAGWVESHE